MIEYSRRSFNAIAFLFRPYNDMDIYVEDEQCRNMYEILFERMLEGRAKIKRVFQLGGKDQVLTACRKDQDDMSRRRLYIIDGDFEVLYDKYAAPELKHLYQLRVYCAENLIFTKNAIHEVAFESLPNEPRENVGTIVEYHLLTEELQKLIPLFSVYVAVYSLDKSLQTVSYNVTGLIEKNGSQIILSETKIANRINEVKGKLCEQFSKEFVEAEIEKAYALLPTDPKELTKFISGKTYLLPLLYHYLKAKIKFSGTLHQFKIRLARHCELDVDAGLLETVRKVSRG